MPPFFYRKNKIPDEVAKNGGEPVVEWYISSSGLILLPPVRTPELQFGRP